MQNTKRVSAAEFAAVAPLLDSRMPAKNVEAARMFLVDGATYGDIKKSLPDVSSRQMVSKVVAKVLQSLEGYRKLIADFREREEHPAKPANADAPAKKAPAKGSARSSLDKPRGEKASGSTSQQSPSRTKKAASAPKTAGPGKTSRTRSASPK